MAADDMRSSETAPLPARFAGFLMPAGCALLTIVFLVPYDLTAKRLTALREARAGQGSGPL